MPGDGVPGYPPAERSVVTPAGDQRRASEAQATIWEWLTRFGGVLAILASAWFGLSYLLSSEITKAILPLREDIAAIKARLDGLEKRQDRIETQALPALLANPLPSNREQALEVIRERQQRLADARRRGIKTDPSAVAHAIDPVLAFESRTEGASAEIAWNAASEIAAYRSFLNVGREPQPANVRPVRGDSGEWNINFDGKGGVDVALSIAGLVPAAQAARSELIANPKNQDKTMGPGLIIFSYAGDDHRAHLRLDGRWIKNVIFRNMTIVYRGGPVILDSVYFVNCEFDIQRGGTGRQIITQIAKSLPTSLSAPSGSAKADASADRQRVQRPVLAVS